MAIAVVQKSAVGKFNGSLTATATLTGVTAGNTLVLLVSHANGDASPAGATTSCYDGATHNSTTKFAFGRRSSANLSRAAEIHYKQSVTAGTHAVDSVAGFGAAANSSGQIMLFEVSGMDNTVLVDASAGVGTNTTTPQAVTGALTYNNEIIFAVCMGTTALTGATSPPAGASFVNDYTDLGASELATCFSHALVTTTTSVTADWSTLTTSTLTCTAVASFKPATAGVFGITADMQQFTKVGGFGNCDYYLMTPNGTETYTGRTVAFTVVNNPVLVAAQKSFTRAAQSANLNYARNLTPLVAQGYNFTRSAAPNNLIYTPVDQGSVASERRFTFSGIAANLVYTIPVVIAAPMRTTIGGVKENNTAGMRTSVTVIQ